MAPTLVVWELGALGIVRSPLVSVVAALALSLAMSSAGAAWWQRRHPSDGVLFGDLVAWSWIRRWRIERRLDDAQALLAGTEGPERDAARQARLLRSLADSLESRDRYTYGHSRRVARFSVLIAKRMGLPKETVAKVRAAAAVHDVGKIKVPRTVLNKAGRLTEGEFGLIKRHAEYSARLVRALGDEEVTAIVRHHHERLDGTGYPNGLAGDAVPLGSRIIAVADTFDALTSRRPYRRPKSHKAAMAILAAEAGTQLDPEAVRAFRGCYSGRRALTLWTAATLLPERLLAALGGGIGGGAASTAQLASAAAATALVGASLVVATTPPTSEAKLTARRSAALRVPAQYGGERPSLLVAAPPSAIRPSPPNPLGPTRSRDPRAPGSNATSGAQSPTPRHGSGAAAPGAEPPAGGSDSGAGQSGALGSSVGGSNAAAPAASLPKVPADEGGGRPAIPNAGGGVPSLPSPAGPLPDTGSVTGRLLPDPASARGLVPRSLRPDGLD